MGGILLTKPIMSMPAIFATIDKYSSMCYTEKVI